MPKDPSSITEVHESSGNVFEDLGLPNSAQELARAELARKIAALIAERGLTQTNAAKLLGIDQPGVSDLVRGKLTRYSSERLIRFLLTLGHDVEIRVRPMSKHRTCPVFRVVTDSKPRVAAKRKKKLAAARSRK